MPELIFKSPNTSKHYKGKLQEGFLKSQKMVIHNHVMTKKTGLLQTMEQVSKDSTFHFLVLLAFLVESKSHQKAK